MVTRVRSSTSEPSPLTREKNDIFVARPIWPVCLRSIVYQLYWKFLNIFSLEIYAYNTFITGYTCIHNFGTVIEWGMNTLCLPSIWTSGDAHSISFSSEAAGIFIPVVTSAKCKFLSTSLIRKNEASFEKSK